MGNLLGETSLGHALMTFISFFILLYCIHRFAWKPIMAILEKRRHIIEKDLQESHQKKISAIQANEEANERLMTAKMEASHIISGAKKQGEHLTQQLKEEAERDIEEMKTQAKQRLEFEREHALAELEETVANVSLGLAEKILQRDIKEEDHRRLINDFIHRLEDEVKHG